MSWWMLIIVIWLALDLAMDIYVAGLWAKSGEGQD